MEAVTEYEAFIKDQIITQTESWRKVMKKGKLLATLLCSASMVMGSMVPTVPAMADAMKVVTLGADLSDEQKNTMLKYFKVDSSQAQIIYVTNQDERDHLSSYVPLEQIGTRTVSCAYVKPTTFRWHQGSYRQFELGYLQYDCKFPFHILVLPTVRLLLHAHSRYPVQEH